MIDARLPPDMHASHYMRQRLSVSQLPIASIYLYSMAAKLVQLHSSLTNCETLLSTHEYQIHNSALYSSRSGD